MQQVIDALHVSPIYARRHGIGFKHRSGATPVFR